MKFRLELEGGKELQAKLSELDRKIENKISRKALRAGAKVVHPEIKRRAPKRKGTLRSSFKVRAGRRKKNWIRFLIQTREGDYKGKTFYGSFLTFGWKTGMRGGRGFRGKGKISARRQRFLDSRRQIPGNPFIADAWAAKKYQVLRTVISHMKQGIAEVKKA